MATPERQNDKKAHGARPGEFLLKLERGLGEELRVEWSRYRGRERLNIRLYFKPEKPREGPALPADGFLPTKRGVTLRPGELRALVDAIERAMELADGRAAAAPLDSRARAQLQLAERLEATVERFVGGDPARGKIVPRSFGVLIGRLRRRPERLTAKGDSQAAQGGAATPPESAGGAETAQDAR